MKTSSIIVANLKCTGCAATIKEELMTLKGVTRVDVDVDKDLVTLSGDDGSREVALLRLNELGYPEATEKNGLLLQLKSYASCMRGKIKNIESHKQQK